MPIPHADSLRRFTLELPSELRAIPRSSLGISSVVGLLGGDDAISAMTAVHVYGNRSLLGWYNTPGSFQIAKRLNSFAMTTSVCDIFGNNTSKAVWVEPTSLLGLDSYNYKGPKFCAAHSGAIMEETGYVAALLAKLCAACSEVKVVPGVETQRIGVTIADLGAAKSDPADSDTSVLHFAILPIVFSLVACTVCGLVGDWYALSSIVTGIIANGISCMILSSSEFEFTHPEPPQGAPRGDGILGSDKDIVLLRGEAYAVNSITRGKYILWFSSKASYNRIQWCPFLFFIQSITQLFLIPQASLFGQIMFLSSLGVSALYNTLLSSLDKEKIHRKFLFENVLGRPKLIKYMLGTRTAAAVFILLVLQPQDPMKLLHELLPNDTRAWKHWKAMISMGCLNRPSDKSFWFEGTLYLPEDFTAQEIFQLRLSYEDAWAAYQGYKGYLKDIER